MKNNIRDVIRYIDYYDNNILGIQSENASYISEQSISSFAKLSGIQSNQFIIDKLNEKFNNVSIVSEDSDVGSFLAILENLNVQEIEDINQLNQIVDYIFDKFSSIISRKDFNDKENLEIKIKKIDKMIRDIDDELEVLDDDKRPNDNMLSNKKFALMFIGKLIHITVFEVIKPILFAATFNPVFGAITGAKLGYNMAKVIITYSNYKSLLIAYKQKLTNIKSTLEKLKTISAKEKDNEKSKK